MDKTICLGMNCKVRTKCGRYGLYANAGRQSYIFTCKDKKEFVGKKRFKKTY